MPRHIENHDLWEKARRNMDRKLPKDIKPQFYYAMVTNEYKRLGGKFFKPGKKKKPLQRGFWD